MDSLLEQIQKEVICAGITGPDGTIWYTTPGLVTNELELRTIVGIFEKGSTAIYNGFTFQGKKFQLTAIDNNSFVAETNSSIFSVFRSDNFFVFTYEDQRRHREKCINVCEYIYNQILEKKLCH